MIASTRHPWPRHVATLSHHERHHGCDDGRHHVRHHVRHHLLAWNDSNEGALSSDGIPVSSTELLFLTLSLEGPFVPLAGYNTNAFEPNRDRRTNRPTDRPTDRHCYL